MYLDDALLGVEILLAGLAPELFAIRDVDDEAVALAVIHASDGHVLGAVVVARLLRLLLRRRLHSHGARAFQFATDRLPKCLESPCGAIRIRPWRLGPQRLQAAGLVPL